jgi:hypothetical protein
VLWIVFDELDLRIAFEGRPSRIAMPAFARSGAVRFCHLLCELFDSCLAECWWTPWSDSTDALRAE